MSQQQDEGAQPPTADAERSGREDPFQTTHWSIVLHARRSSTIESQQAMSQLCQTYWWPLYTYARRQTGDQHQAQDLTQAFFTKLLEKDYLREVNPLRGKFRAFLLTALKRFISNEWDKQTAQKRGGGQAPISLDFESADSRLRIEPAAGLTAEQCYDQQWAIALLGQIMQRLEAEFQSAGKSEQFGLLKGFIIGDHAGETYAQVAEQLNMTEAAAKKSASRMRKRYGELLREEISQTVAGPDEVQDEIRKLFAVLEL